MAPMICNTHAGKRAGCFYGNQCCASALHAAGHKRKRRALKRSERQRVRNALRSGSW